jgi:hypothetical protein
LLPALRQWHDRPQNTLLCGFARLWLRGLRLAHATARKPARALLQSFQIGGDRRS